MAQSQLSKAASYMGKRSYQVRLERFGLVGLRHNLRHNRLFRAKSKLVTY